MSWRTRLSRPCFSRSRWPPPPPRHGPPAFHVKMGADSQTDVHRAGLSGQSGLKATSTPAAWRSPRTNSLRSAPLPVPRPLRALPSSAHPSHIRFLPPPGLLRPQGWEHRAGWTGGLVSASRAFHFKVTPSPPTPDPRGEEQSWALPPDQEETAPEGGRPPPRTWHRPRVSPPESLGQQRRGSHPLFVSSFNTCWGGGGSHSAGGDDFTSR